MTLDRIRMVAAIALLLVAGGREVVRRLPTAIPVVSAGHSEQAQKLRRTLSAASRADRCRLGGIYSALSEAVRSGKVESTEILMQGTSIALDLAFASRKLVPGVDVGAEIDAVVAASIGHMNAVSITDANKAAVAHGLSEVAWACGE